MLLMLSVQFYILELVSILIIHIRSATSSNKTSVTEEVSQTVNCVSDVRGTYYFLLTTSFHRFVTRPLAFRSFVAGARITINLPPTDSRTPFVNTDPIGNRICKTVSNNTTRHNQLWCISNYGQDNCSVRNSGNSNILEQCHNIENCCGLFILYQKEISVVIVLWQCARRYSKKVVEIHQPVWMSLLVLHSENKTRKSMSVI